VTLRQPRGADPASKLAWRHGGGASPSISDRDTVGKPIKHNRGAVPLDRDGMTNSRAVEPIVGATNYW
jgi:hypothetical protein